MHSMPRARSIRGVAAAALGLALLGSVPARAQSDADLAAARTLFTQAVHDEDEHRYDTALDEFRRVAAVRDTANVQYRIASCLEKLGRLADALAAYEKAVRIGSSEKAAADVVRAASARAADLDRTVPRLTIVVPADAPAGTEVRVDDVPVDAATLHDAIPLDPGHHTIAAAAPGDLPFRTAVTLPEGGRVSITVTLSPAVSVPPVPTASGSASASAGPPPPPPPPPPPVDASQGARVWGWIALGGGAALAAGSVVSLVLRSSNLDTMNRDCTEDGSGALSCPTSKQSEVTHARDAARIEGPLGIGLAAGAAIAVGAGIWLLATAPSSHKEGLRLVPAGSSTMGMLVLTGPIDR